MISMCEKKLDVPAKIREGERSTVGGAAELVDSGA